MLAALGRLADRVDPVVGPRARMSLEPCRPPPPAASADALHAHGGSVEAPAAPGRAALLKGRVERETEETERKKEAQKKLVERMEVAAQWCKERRAVLDDKGFQRLRQSSAGSRLVADPWDRKRGRVVREVNEFDVLVEAKTAWASKPR